MVRIDKTEIAPRKTSEQQRLEAQRVRKVQLMIVTYSTSRDDLLFLLDMVTGTDFTFEEDKNETDTGTEG